MKTMNIKKVLSVLLVMLAMVVTMAAPAFADEPASSEPATTQSAQAETEAEGKIRTSMMLTLVFIETAIIYALLVVILIIFVL